ncbi:hypothetical protein AVEN_16020-1 [Araneus ventricosus]|uniref:Uncharacterized protein n=1 Tax=Araneus ventricosus TaxID=182803 RepID=A0A4Y2K2Y2_ARAVE|nr:hypothetical protein AVEN_16020-1 [Araneus ventricosus]
MNGEECRRDKKGGEEKRRKGAIQNGISLLYAGVAIFISCEELCSELFSKLFIRSRVHLTLVVFFSCLGFAAVYSQDASSRVVNSCRSIFISFSACRESNLSDL